jgi:hypothetical protein
LVHKRHPVAAAHKRCDRVGRHARTDVSHQAVESARDI